VVVVNRITTRAKRTKRTKRKKNINGHSLLNRDYTCRLTEDLSPNQACS
jgi:hypothetical protein